MTGRSNVTGTAHPLNQYLESYVRAGRTYPFAIPEHIVVLETWKPGILKVSLTKLIRAAAGMTLAEAKRCTDEVLVGKPVTLTFPSTEQADRFCADAQDLGVVAKRETRFL